LDRLDVSILREFVQDRGTYPLQSDFRQSFRKVAGKLEIDGATVRHRIKKLRESGFMKDLYVFANPGLFYLRVAHARVVVSQPGQLMMKDDAIRKIKLVHGVWTIVNHFGISLRVVLYFEDEASLRKQIELIARISNCEDVLYREVHFPPCGMALSEDDLALVVTIQTDPTKSYGRIAREIGLSYKTVKRMLERMHEGRALFIIPSLVPRSLTGATLAELLVLYENPEAMRKANGAIASHVDEYLMSAQLGDPEHLLFLLALTNISQVKEILDWVRRQPGVKNAFLDLVEERVELYEAFSRQLNRKLAQVRSAGHGRHQTTREFGHSRPGEDKTLGHEVRLSGVGLSAPMA